MKEIIVQVFVNPSVLLVFGLLLLSWGGFYLIAPSLKVFRLPRFLQNYKPLNRFIKLLNKKSFIQWVFAPVMMILGVLLIAYSRAYIAPTKATPTNTQSGEVTKLALKNSPSRSGHQETGNGKK